MTRKEKRYVLLSIPATTALFIVGVLLRLANSDATGAWLSCMEFQAEIFEPEWTADGYISFVTSLLFWMGVAFQTPLIFFLISLMGLVSARTLDKAVARRGCRRLDRCCALITPTIDPVNMFLVMAPLLTLYALSIVLGLFRAQNVRN